MAVTALVGDYDTTTMLGVVEETKRVKTFLRERFCGDNLDPVETRDVMLDFVGSDRAMAPIVSRHQNGKLIEKQPTVSGRYRPPKLAPLDVLGEDVAFERAPGEVIGGSMSPEERRAAYAARQLLRHERLIVKRWEWMLAKLLSTGVIQLDGEGVRDTIDVGHIMQVILSGDDLWGTATANILRNLRDWTDDIIEECGITPDTLVLGRDAADAMLEDEKIAKMLDVRNISIGSLNPREIPSGAIYMGTLEGIDVFRYPDWYKDDLTKASTPMIPANMAVLGCSTARNPDQRIVFGAHYEVDEDKTYAQTLIPRVWVDKGRNVRFMEVVSYPVPILPNVGAWLRAVVR